MLCAICLEELTEKDAAGRIIPKMTAECTHEFHMHCLQQYAAAGKSDCPVCRQAWVTTHVLFQPAPAPPPPPPTTRPPPAPAPAPGAPSKLPVPPPTGFDDDEELAVACGPVPVAARSDTAAAVGAPRGDVFLRAVPDVRLIPKTAAQTRTMLVTVEARSGAALGGATEDKRGGVDLVLVLDVSGSMQGNKIALVKRTVEQLTEQLQSQDRVSVVSFDDRARRVTKLLRMTDEGKLKLRSQVRGLG